MRVKVIFIALLCWSLMYWPGSARADEYQLAGQIVSALEGAWDVKKNQAVQPAVDGLAAAKLGQPMDNKSTGSKIELELYYPQGSGQPEIDKWLKAYAEKKLAAYQAEAKEFLAEKQSQPGWKSMIFLATRPSENYLTVVFYESGYTGGAHGYRAYEAITFDRQTGRPLTVQDIFNNPDDEGQRARGFFINYLNAALDLSCFERYKDSLCQPNAVKPEPLAESAKNLVFTPQGLAVIFSPYEQGSYAEGAKYVDIPKSELMAWGLSDQYWK